MRRAGLRMRHRQKIVWQKKTDESAQRKRELAARSLFEKVRDDGGHALLLPVGHRGKERQRQHFFARALGHREVARLVAQRRITLLEMQRQRVVNGIADAVRVEW